MKKQAGFTLLEILVAVAVLGMLILLLNQGLQFGLRAAAMQGRLDDGQGDLEAVDRALRQIVARAAPAIPPAPATFRGTEAALLLATELPDPVDGHLEPVEASIGLSGDRLRLRWRPRVLARPFGPPPPFRDLVLLGGVTAIRFAYAAGDRWAAAWTADQLPTLIRITVTLGGGRHWPPIVAAPLRAAPPT